MIRMHNIYPWVAFYSRMLTSAGGILDFWALILGFFSGFWIRICSFSPEPTSEFAYLKPFKVLHNFSNNWTVYDKYSHETKISNGYRLILDLSPLFPPAPTDTNQFFVFISISFNFTKKINHIFIIISILLMGNHIKTTAFLREIYLYSFNSCKIFLLNIWLIDWNSM